MNLPERFPSGREAENLHYHTSQPHTIASVTNGSKSMEFDYDANGNMTEVVNKTGSTVTSTETLFWNESNQLQADHNLGGLHHFMYDSNGERYLKGTLLFNSVDVDGNPISGTDVSTSDYTVYVNPYMVYNSKYETNSGYSKHYYVGSERVASAIGTGDFKGNSDPQTGPSTESLTAHPIWSVLNDYLDDLEIEIGGYDGYESTEGEPLHSTYESCIETYGSYQDEIDNCLCLYFPSYAQSQSIHCEDYAPIYWYHPDYLGNTEFVSDRMGRPYQHFYYSPFGEELVEQEPYNADYYSPYHFNAKEVDPETGYHYYGARYYNSNLSVWLSVDPKADAFPQATPYNAFLNNPVMMVDPGGDSTFVVSIGEGVYAVQDVRGMESGDRGIYVVEGNSESGYSLTGERVGETLTTHSFVGMDGRPIVGSQIDLNSSDGQDFFDYASRIESFSYGLNANSNQKYDYKTQGIDKLPMNMTAEQYQYRGSVLNDGRIASARDIGNMVAGFHAGKEGLDWGFTRKVFDMVSGGVEPPVSQLAQKEGWLLGRQNPVIKRRFNPIFKL